MAKSNSDPTTPNVPKVKREPTQLVACVAYANKAGQIKKVYITDLAPLTPGWTATGKVVQRAFGEGRKDFRQRVDAIFDAK